MTLTLDADLFAGLMTIATLIGLIAGYLLGGLFK